jgi:hypothetical protein
MEIIIKRCETNFSNEKMCLGIHQKYNLYEKKIDVKIFEVLW